MRQDDLTTCRTARTEKLEPPARRRETMTDRSLLPETRMSAASETLVTAELWPNSR